MEWREAEDVTLSDLPYLTLDSRRVGYSYPTESHGARYEKTTRPTVGVDGEEGGNVVETIVRPREDDDMKVVLAL